VIVLLDELLKPVDVLFSVLHLADLDVAIKAKLVVKHGGDSLHFLVLRVRGLVFFVHLVQVDLAVVV